MSLNAIGKLHRAIRPFTIQLDYQFRAAKKAIGCRNTAVTRGIPSTATSSDTYHLSNNPLPNINKIPVSLDSLDSGSDCYTNSTSRASIAKPTIPGILIEADPEEKNCPWRQAADHNHDQASAVDEIRSTDSASHPKSLQKNATPVFQSHDFPAHSMSTSSSQQPPTLHTLNSSTMTEHDWFHDFRDNDAQYS